MEFTHKIHRCRCVCVCLISHYTRDLARRGRGGEVRKGMYFFFRCRSKGGRSFYKHLWLYTHALVHSVPTRCVTSTLCAVKASSIGFDFASFRCRLLLPHIHTHTAGLRAGKLAEARRRLPGFRVPRYISSSLCGGGKRSSSTLFFCFRTVKKALFTR